MGKEEYGIENLTKVVDVVVEVGNVIPEVMAATSLVGRIRAVSALTDEVLALMKLKPGELPKEFKDFSDEEKKEMKVHINAKFDIENDLLEALIEEAIGLGIEQLNLGNKMVTLAKKFKAKPAEATA